MQDIQSNTEPKFKKAIQWSLVFHVSLFIFGMVSELIYPTSPKESTPSLRVDLVALPDFKKDQVPEITPDKEPPANVTPKESAATEAPLQKSDSGDVALKKKSKAEREQKMKAALTRLKALAALQEFKGNQISKGSVTSGEAKEALQTTYFDLVLEKVRNEWELPKWLQERELSAKVIVTIARNGSIIRVQFQKRSGDETFDSEVKAALIRAAPFPMPPPEIASDLMTNGILMGFPI